ncbi:MAG: DUF3291 domain-containing protein [Natronosporangium sp.]
MTGHHHLAELNVARLRAPLDGPELAGFVAQLDKINALADAAPGFVWRLRDSDGDNATALRPYDDGMVIVNMSVWESLDALWDYVYRTVHLDLMRHRREWFHRMADHHLVLWWLPAGELPTLAEGIDRLERLRKDGPGRYAFTFRQPVPPPDGAVVDGAPAVGRAPG